MKNLKKIIKHKVLSLGFDVVGFSKPQIDSNTKKNYRQSKIAFKHKCKFNFKDYKFIKKKNKEYENTMYD